MERIVRRLGVVPRQRCDRNYACPDVLLLESGNVYVIGRRVDSAAYRDLLSWDARVGADEEVVLLPREVYRAALLADVRSRPLELAKDLVRDWMLSIRRLIRQWTLYSEAVFRFG